MRGDYSRKTFDRRKHYSGVLMQQGRVQVDADWNEQLDVQLYRTETESTDVIGATGVPKKNGGFKIAAAVGGRDLTISAGRLYVGGLLCELDQATTYTTQPYFPNPEHTAPASPTNGGLQLTLSDGSYLAYLDAWQREVTARDTGHRLMREVALGGPDTSTRLQTVYQVRLLRLDLSSPLSPLSPLTCQSPIAAIDQNPGLSTGTMNARTQPPQNQANPCVLPPSAGFTRLENQLYRVEIHTGGPLSQATFKWARDAVETTVQSIAGNVITVADVGPDDVLGFAPQQWVEIVDDESALKRTPHPLVSINAVDPDLRQIKVSSSLASLAGRPGLKLRRWDQSGPAASATGISASLSNWIDLEDGVQVRFSTAGEFRSGDFWDIPARTVTGEIEWPPYQIPNSAPIPQPPRGVRHHYARLALFEVIGGMVAVREDCRKPFPGLTEICAEDVCFENDACNLVGVETVQEAIDRLCEERDLRFHKKHLHGWGIVCGLQVHCGPGPRTITVRKGYAIGCEGDDIRVRADETIDLFDLVASTIGFPPASPLASPLPGVPDTEVCLILDSNPSATERYRVERFEGHDNSLKSILEGTLLLDVFEDCILSLVEFFRKETTPQPGEENLPVGPTQKRITTFLNLLVQLFNKQNGSFVFLSGEAGQSNPNFEDTILRGFYTRLRALLQSQTFCAMFDKARQFPAYPYSNLGIATIFGKGQKTRFRVAPGGGVGYAVGAGNTINVFDLARGEMVEELVFPGAPNVIVEDVAIARDGRQLYAVATMNDKDTLFAIADIAANGLGHVFRAPTLICDVQLVSVVMAPAPSLNVLAIGKGPGKGLYDINPLNPVNPANPTAPISPKYVFNAVGHLVMDQQFAYATASSGTTATNTYNRVMKLNVVVTDPNPPVFPLTFNNQQLTGEDDIAFGVDQQRKLFVAVNPPPNQTQKHLLVYNTDVVAAPLALTNLQQNTTIRLAHNPLTDHLMVAYEDIFRVGMVDAQNALIAEWVPVQIGPIWIAVSPDETRVYVLNYWSNTISSIPAARFAAGQQIPLQPLVDYRAGVLNAIVDLFGGLLQYLKDCFCDHLLVDCPTCDEEDEIYLACISIKNNKVHKVCNFSHRKYVHTFPTWGYWLSAVPILPIIKHLVAQLCCAELPALFGRYQAPTPEPPVNTTTAPQNTVNSSSFRHGATLLARADFRGTIDEQRLKVRTGGGVINDALASITTRTFTTRPPVAHTDVAGRSVADARQRLANANIVIAGEQEYDPAAGGRNLSRYLAAPVRLAPGDRVNLVTKEGKVLFYTKGEEPLPDLVRTRLDASVAETLQLRQEVTTLRSELLQVRQAHQSDIQTRDAQIATLQATVRDAQSAAQSVRDFRDRLERLERRP